MDWYEVLAAAPGRLAEILGGLVYEANEKVLAMYYWLASF